MTMKIQETSLAGCLLIEPDYFGDHRGGFMELYRESRYREHGLSAQFVQDNFSRSSRGTLRGMHYQLQSPQGKLVQVIRGEIYDVAVDLRKDSPTFGQWTSARLSGENHHQFYVAEGCAHGFYVLSETADVIYKCTRQYEPEDERVLLWNDPELAIDWPLAGEPTLSEKDLKGTPFADCDVYFPSDVDSSQEGEVP